MDRHEAVSFRNVRFPDEELMGVDGGVVVSEQHFAHVCHVVEGKASDSLVVNHAVQREGASTVVRNHA